MTTTTLPAALQQTDADLVTASRGGDREAFGQIVRRYQSMVSGLLYATCGDLHRSEDLAQETFVSAWKSLSGLRDPAKLPGWLCQIARHRLTDRSRSAAREDARMRGMFQTSKPEPHPGPEQEAVEAEERELLWRTLSTIPQPYRETLVLYYRQGRSTEQVAAATETTEPTVRKRLERGRELLREEMAQLLERQIPRTAPRPEFALAVVAVLPAIVPSTAQAAGMGVVAAKGGGASWVANLAGPAAGFGGAMLVMLHTFRGIRSRKELGVMVVGWVAFWGVVVAVAMGNGWLTGFGRERGWDDATKVVARSAYWCGYGVTIVTVLWAMGTWRAVLRRKAGIPVEAPKPGPVAGVVLLSCATVGGLGWLVHVALAFGDVTAAWVVAAGIVLLTAAFVVTGRRLSPAAGAFAGSWSGVILATIVAAIALVLDWRLRTWLAIGYRVDVSEMARRIPLWPINVAAGVVIAWIALAVRVTRRAMRPA